MEGKVPEAAYGRWAEALDRLPEAETVLAPADFAAWEKEGRRHRTLILQNGSDA